LLEDFRRVYDSTRNHIRKRTTRNVHSYLSHAARLEALFRLQSRLRLLINAEERDGSRYCCDDCRRYSTVKTAEQGWLQFAFMASVLRDVLRRLSTCDKSVKGVYDKLDAQSRNGCSLQKLVMYIEQEAFHLLPRIYPQHRRWRLRTLNRDTEAEEDRAYYIRENWYQRTEGSVILSEV